MPGDELAAELLTTALNADPLAGSLSGVPGYDALLPDFSQSSETARTRALESIATRAEQASETGLEETELQTLDFVRYLARGMAGAAAVPVIEFTISDTFAAPVGGVLTSLPKLPLDSEERRAGYLTRLRGLSDMLTTVAQRHEEGARQGRTAVARLVEAAIAQLDLLLEDPTVGGMIRTDPDCVLHRRRLRRHRRPCRAQRCRPTAMRCGPRCSRPPATTSTRASATSRTARRCTGPWPFSTRP